MAAINVTVSGSGSIVADVSGNSAADVMITSDPPVGVSVTGGIGPAAIINEAATAVIGVNPIVAGANITVSTASANYTIIGRDVPVQSVQGRTGNVTVTLVDLSAAAFTHTHSTSQITGYTAPPVLSVQGRTGNVTLALNDLTAAAATHTHSASDITGLAAAAAAVAPVQSVQSRTGAVVITRADLTAAAATHTHNASDITDLPVTSVQGRTGAVVVSRADLTAAAESHTHTTTEISGFSASFVIHSPVKSLNGLTGALSLNGMNGLQVVSSGTSVSVDLPSQSGAAARLLGSDGTNANWFSLVQGANVSLTPNTTSRTIQISATGGGGGPPSGGTSIWPAIVFGD